MKEFTILPIKFTIILIMLTISVACAFTPVVATVNNQPYVYTSRQHRAYQVPAAVWAAVPDVIGGRATK